MLKMDRASQMILHQTNQTTKLVKSKARLAVGRPKGEEEIEEKNLVCGVFLVCGVCCRINKSEKLAIIR